MNSTIFNIPGCLLKLHLFLVYLSGFVFAVVSFLNYVVSFQLAQGSFLDLDSWEDPSGLRPPLASGRVLHSPRVYSNENRTKINRTKVNGLNPSEFVHMVTVDRPG